MEYSKFLQLLVEGEKANVDFKIKCDAFNSPKLSPKAELAKDICAMANNGNVTSYIIIGVSNDRSDFTTVSNPKLTDDALQDFCKKSIHPPPKIKLTRLAWKKGVESRHVGKEFVIIQIGRQRREAFRLNQDFIDYREEVCHRRNEVWIRRGATTDLATPEEIARLIKGEPPIENLEAVELRESRDKFNKSSLSGRLSFINSLSAEILEKEFRYKNISVKDENIAYWYHYQRNPRFLFKQFDNFVILISLHWCRETLIKGDFKYYRFYMLDGFMSKSDIPQPILRRIKGKLIPIRRLWILPVLSTVPVRRIESELTSWQRTGIYKHYYHQFLYKSSSQEIVPSSSELLIIDNISSTSEFQEQFSSAVKTIEQYTNSIIYKH